MVCFVKRLTALLCPKRKTLVKNMEEEASLNSFCSILETSHSFAVNLISFHNAPSFSNSEMVFPFKD